jgi:hypothetical protein
MTLVPFTECCLQLGIDPKTLRLWLKSAHLSCCLHSADARLKCLTHDQLTQLAELHGRRLPAPADHAEALPPASPALQATSPATAVDSSTAFAFTEAAELRHQLTLLQGQVATLQGQVTELALALLRGSFSQFSISASAPPQLSSRSPAHSTPTQTSRSKTPASRVSSPALEQPPARSRAQPLIEVRADGTYVVISPTEGVLSLAPDSPEWFAWLASLTAFSFQGKLGRYSASRKFRDGQRIQSWMAHRSLHGRSCGLYLGQTLTLTLARLEEMAATVQARLTAL